MKSVRLNNPISSMLLLKIISAGLPILLLEYLRRSGETVLIGGYQSMISSLEVVVSILLVGTGQFFIKTKPTNEVVLRVLNRITLSAIIFSLLVFNYSGYSPLLIISSLILRFIAQFFYLEKVIFWLHYLIITHNYIFNYIVSSNEFRSFQKLSENALVFSSLPKILIGIIAVLFISIETLKETYSYYLPRVFNIIRSNIDILIIPLYLDSTTFATYVFLTRWSKLISFPITVFVNYLSPKYIEFKEKKNKLLALLRNYYKTLIPYATISCTFLFIYLNQIKTAESLLILLALLTPTINLLFGPIGIPINLGKHTTRNNFTLYNIFESVIYFKIIANFINNLKGILFLELFRIIIFNTFKYLYVKRYEW